jgi:peptidoglycan/LPS O-acetylase OafA/YrhL
MASYLPIWCLGAGLRVWPVKVNSLAGSLLALVFLGSLVVSTRFPGTATNYLIAGGISGVILWLGNREMRSAHFRKFSHFLASFSFSTYAIHYPLIGFLLNWLSPIRRNTASLIDWLEWGALALMVFSFCWLIYFCFERHTGRVRGWLAGKT